MGRERKQRYREEPEAEEERERVGERERGRIIACVGSECIVAKPSKRDRLRKMRSVLSFVKATSLQRSLRKKIEEFALLLIKTVRF